MTRPLVQPFLHSLLTRVPNTHRPRYVRYTQERAAFYMLYPEDAAQQYNKVDFS